MLEAKGIVSPKPLQKKTFGTIKGGADCVVAAAESDGKSTAIAISTIQKLENAFEQSPRALIIVQDKIKVLEMEEMFDKYGAYTDLRVYGVYEQGDVDYDKNQISAGIDVLIGTPGRLNTMFSTAGFDINQLKMFIVDDAALLLKVRHDNIIKRLSDSIAKTQRIFFTDVVTDRVATLAEKIMIEPLYFEFDNENESQENDDEVIK